jgi:hypothetical protein
MERMNYRVLQGGLYSQNPDRMLRMLKTAPVATDGKFTLRRYIRA